MAEVSHPNLTSPSSGASAAKIATSSQQAQGADENAFKNANITPSATCANLGKSPAKGLSTNMSTGQSQGQEGETSRICVHGSREHHDTASHGHEGDSITKSTGTERSSPSDLTSGSGAGSQTQPLLGATGMSGLTGSQKSAGSKTGETGTGTGSQQHHIPANIEQLPQSQGQSSQHKPDILGAESPSTSSQGAQVAGRPSQGAPLSGTSGSEAQEKHMTDAGQHITQGQTETIAEHIQGSASQGHETKPHDTTSQDTKHIPSEKEAWDPNTAAAVDKTTCTTAPTLESDQGLTDKKTGTKASEETVDPAECQPGTKRKTAPPSPPAAKKRSTRKSAATTQ